MEASIRLTVSVSMRPNEGAAPTIAPEHAAHCVRSKIDRHVLQCAPLRCLHVHRHCTLVAGPHKNIDPLHDHVENIGQTRRGGFVRAPTVYLSVISGPGARHLSTITKSSKELSWNFLEEKENRAGYNMRGGKTSAPQAHYIKFCAHWKLRASSRKLWFNHRDTCVQKRGNK